MVAYEVRQPASGGEPVIRMNFKNGTQTNDFTTYNMFGNSGDTPLSMFVSTLAVSSVPLVTGTLELMIVITACSHKRHSDLVRLLREQFNQRLRRNRSRSIL